MKKLRFLILPVLVVVVSACVLASSPFDTSYKPTTKSIAMGGSGVAFLDDAGAMRLNPAALNQINAVSVLAEGAASFDELSNLVNVLSSRSALAKLKDGYESRVEGFLGFSTNRFGLGLATLVTVSKDQNKAEVYTFRTSNVALALPFGILWKAFDNTYIGANIKLHHPVLEEFDLSGEKMQKKITRGSGQGFDLGLLVDFGSIKLGASASDLSAFISMDGESQPEDIAPRFAVGASVDFFHKKRPGLIALAIDYTDVYLSQGVQNGTLRVGMENILFKTLTIRSGITAKDIFHDARVAQYSAGLGVKLGPVVLDFAVVSSDLSTENMEGSLSFEIRL